ncbi:MAG: hypothetical protein DDT31_01028 [Syntrophomonadaceae bacterium]|nr:hypothetical protein [Bacillota bacterium]
MRYLKKELLLMVIGLCATAVVWLFVYTPAAREIKTSRVGAVRLEKEIDALHAAARRTPLIEKEIAALSLKIEHLRIEEHLMKRSPLHIMDTLSKLATEVEISPIRLVEAKGNWQGFEMTVNAPSFSSFGAYIENLHNSHLLLKIRYATIKLCPDGRGLRVELSIDGWIG